MKRFGVYRRRVVTTGNLDGREPVFEYVAAREFGEHDDRAAARRACMEMWDAELVGTSDYHIKAHYDAMARNLKIYKVSTL